ncbi:MAG: multidrug ABC transporter ATPase [Microbacterium sp.]|uniref:multidrug ABC transporter ATPase n=1 Tax=Microbacterium sp. TaxID=51671 RepID=UPI0039E27785
MSKPAADDVPVRPIDRIFATIALGLLIVSVACFFSIMIGTAAGAQFGTGVWPVVGVVTYVAPILAFAFMLTVLIRSFVRRARANRAR